MNSTSPRLPWERYAPASFVAYPRGKDRPDVVAHLTKKPERPHYKWGWHVQVGPSSAAGDAPTKQEAANAATVAWPQVVRDAELRAAEAEALARLQAKLDEIAETGAVDIAEFAIEDMAGDAMLKLMRECRERWVVAFHAGGSMPGIEALMSALSVEFFRRRLMGDATV